jgi:AcrR family transcriptional regulator
MARPSKFTEEQMFDAALRLVADGGPGAATIAGLAGTLGAPVGSIYHRFRSRDLLLARLWLRTIKRFQRGFLDALADEDLDRAALGSAQYAVRWVRDHLDEARLLMLYRREDLLAARWPGDLAADLAALNTGIEAALREHARRRYGRDDPPALGRVTFALVDVPYAAARRYLAAGQPPPPAVDDLVAATCRCILSGGAGSGQ